MMREGHDIAKIDPAHGRQGAADARRHPGVQGAVGRRHHASTSRCASRRRRRCSRPRPARPSSARSSAGSTTSATNGMELIREIVEIFDNYEFTTEVLVASCRHPIHIIEAARMGADICTCPPAVIDQLFNHPLTDIGLEKFLKDWEKAQAVKAKQP